MRFAVAAAALGLASAQRTYMWSGEMFSMGDPDAWQGANPLGMSTNLPTYSVFGTDNTRLTSSIPTGVTIDVGQRLELHGVSAIYFGNGQAGGNTMITFGSSGSRNNVATFAAPTPGMNMVKPLYDYTCNLNWQVNGNSGQIPGTAPCSNDIVQIPNNNNPYFISSFNANAAARYIELQGGAMSDRITMCNSGDQTYGWTMNVGMLNTVQLTNCQTANMFWNGSPGYTCPSTPTMSQSCASSNANGIVKGTPDGGNIEYTVITYGPFAGQVYIVQGQNFANRTGSVSISTVTAATPSTPGQYRIGNGVFDGTTGQFVVDTLAPTPPVNTAGSSGGSSSGGGGMLLIIIIIIAVIVIIVVVAVVLKKKKAQESSAASHSAVSFENPMYDGAGPEAGGAARPQDGGLYQEPEMGATGGYMDVPAGGDYADEANYDEAGTSGYMDVPAQGESDTGGYMDVDEEDDNDDV